MKTIALNQCCFTDRNERFRITPDLAIKVWGLNGVMSARNVGLVGAEIRKPSCNRKRSRPIASGNRCFK